MGGGRDLSLKLSLGRRRGGKKSGLGFISHDPTPFLISKKPNSPQVNPILNELPVLDLDPQALFLTLFPPHLLEQGESALGRHLTVSQGQTTINMKNRLGYHVQHKPPF